MAWERRGDRRYYYRKRRIGGQVVSEYVGHGELAELQAEMDREAADLRATERCAERAERQAQRAIDAQIDEAGRQLRWLLRAYLLANGYHTHKGQWRKRRERPGGDDGGDRRAHLRDTAASQSDQEA